MLRKSLLILTAAASFSATSATAQDGGVVDADEKIFEVVMLGYGYFPEVAYAGSDWTIKFYNATDTPMAATATDGSWSTGLVAPGESYYVNLVGADGAVMGRDFNNSVPDVQALAEDAGAIAIIDAVETVDVVTDQVVAYGRIENKEAAPSFLAKDGRPMSDAEAKAQYGDANFDTDGDGDADGYDYSAMFKQEFTAPLDSDAAAIYQ
ncbi:hypothetical protein [Roseivivax sp. CAU 1753]